MCFVSMVVQGAQTPSSPNFINWTTFTPDPDTAKRLLEVIERLEKIDARLGLIECKVEEKAKRVFKAKLKRRAAKIQDRSAR